MRAPWRPFASFHVVKRQDAQSSPLFSHLTAHSVETCTDIINQANDHQGDCADLYSFVFERYTFL